VERTSCSLRIGYKPSSKNGVRTLYNWEQLTEIPETDAIVHLASKAHDTKNQSEAAEYFAVNTGLTQKIFDYFLESSAKKFRKNSSRRYSQRISVISGKRLA
jgi:nucleoside-diphosphate-sugar epimerase